jgi:hypothetical protein
MSRGALRGIGRVAAVAAVVCAAATCESKTGPDDPIAIEFNGSQLPSLVKGQELHDTLGNVDSLLATVFNSSGDTIHDASVRYIHADTTTIVNIDSVTGHVTAVDTGFARVVAQAGSLQSNPDTLFVVEQPTQLAAVTPLDDTINFTPVRADSLFPLTVVLHAGDAPVNHYRVEYRFAYPADLNTPDSTRVLLTDENRKFSLVDTTGTEVAAGSGGARRYLRISAFAHSGFSDTVVVEARSFLPDHTPVPGSPIRFTVHVQIH